MRIARNGSWHFGVIFCRAAFRGSFAPRMKLDNLGFRFVRTEP
jgi:formylglycine-generating enzyme required for sulfatase activity